MNANEFASAVCSASSSGHSSVNCTRDHFVLASIHALGLVCDTVAHRTFCFSFFLFLFFFPAVSMTSVKMTSTTVSRVRTMGMTSTRTSLRWKYDNPWWELHFASKSFLYYRRMSRVVWKRTTQSPHFGALHITDTGMARGSCVSEPHGSDRRNDCERDCLCIIVESVCKWGG